MFAANYGSQSPVGGEGGGGWGRFDRAHICANKGLYLEIDV